MSQGRRHASALMLGRHRSDLPVLGHLGLGWRHGGVAVSVFGGVFADAGRSADHLVEDDPHPLGIHLAELLECPLELSRFRLAGSHYQHYGIRVAR